MFRREFLASLAAARLLTAAKARIDRGRISFITDEAAANPADAIQFAKKYGLQWVELREVPGGGGHYMRQSDEALKEAAKQFHDNGIKVSFFDTPMFKITLPGTEPLAAKREQTPEAREKRIAKHQADFDRRHEDFKQAFRAAHILGVDKIRVFTFLRTAEPDKLHQRIADVIGEMAEMAAKEKIKLLVENESACNVVSCAEVARFTKLLPEKTVGINWDPLNGTSQNELPYPDGYKLLPIKRVWNVQAKGHSLLAPDKKLDWPGIFSSLDRDGYRGEVGLETHYFDGTKIEKSHASMVEIFRILESSVNKQVAIAGSIAVLLVAAVVGSILLSTRHNRVELNGTLLRVRTQAIDGDNTVVLADIRITNPSTQQFVVEDVQVLLQPQSGEAIPGDTFSETDAQRLFTYYPVLGKKYNPNLMIRQKINPGETIDRMISVRFPGGEERVQKRKGLRIIVRDIDGVNEIDEKL